MGDESRSIALGGQFGDDLVDVEPIARGGSGRVFRARQSRLGRPVVIKVLETIVLDGEERAITEARAQAAVSWHQNVLTILGEGVTKTGWPYLILEAAEGGTLSERVESDGVLGEADAVALVAQLASALSAAHSAAVVHCDVKPSNVLLARDGSVRLSDFGAASTSQTATLDLVQGSLLFAPPELLEGKTPDASNDIYGLAVTLYFALTGDPPFGDVDQPTAATIARIHTDTLSFEGLGLSGWLADLLTRCAAKEPSDRPTAGDVLSELSANAAHQPAGAMSPGHSTDVAAVAEHMIRERRAVIDRLLAFLGEDHSPVEMVRALLFDLARDSAEATLPIQQLASRRCPELGGRCPSLDEMRRVVVAELLTDMSGGREMLWQGVGEHQTVIAPVGLQQTAKDYNTAIAWAKAEAPEVNWSMGPGYEERIWALLGTVTDGSFLLAFFDDEGSFDLFDVETVALMLGVAMPLFESLIETRWDWLYELMDRRPDIRRMIAYEFPVMLIRGVARGPRTEVAPEWREEIEIGVLRLPSWERSALRQEFGADLNAVGIAI